jgi:hypothetical protein
MRTLAMCLAIVAVLLVVTPPVAAQGDGPKVIASDAVVYGKTYGQWSASWWQWALSFNAPVGHPLFQTGAVDCSIGQAGPVWFLGGRFCANDDTSCGFKNVVRSCAVPANKALFIPIINAEDSKLEELDPNKQIVDLSQYVASNMDNAANLFLQIDGASIPHLKDRFRVQSVAFGYTMPENNVWKALYPPGFAEFAAGTYYPAVDDGVYIMLSPLTPGPHVIRFGGAFPNFGFSFDVTYFLTVTK